MRKDERRKLLVIEQNLRAEAPELAELFSRLHEPSWQAPTRRALWALGVLLVVLGAAVAQEVPLLLGALLLAGMSVIRWARKV